MEKVEKKVEFDTIKIGRTTYHIMFSFIQYSHLKTPKSLV